MPDNRPLLRPAYYAEYVSAFLATDPEKIYAQLGLRHGHDQELEQRSAWIEQITLLRKSIANIPQAWIAFEFSIPRMGKRADAILLCGGIVFVLEFKIGAEEFAAAAIEQVTDYALDLKNFHAASHSRIVVPVLISTDAAPKPVQLELWEDDVSPPIFSTGQGLGDVILSVIGSHADQPSLDPDAWMASAYRPTPTIIEAARALYKGHRVEEITRSDAEKKNLGATTDRINWIIEGAKENNKKVICFVTGVPGAGKTLAGLNLVTQRARGNSNENAVFLSGNGPLVDVLREALARDENERGDLRGLPVKIGDARRKVKSFIQNIHHFRDHYLQSSTAPHELTVVFDEAQRAWDRDKITKFMSRKRGWRDFPASEPEFLIEVMDRHEGWCAIICLIGGGQEINEGEAGLAEWFSALSRRFPRWEVFSSDQLLDPAYHWGKNLEAMISRLDYRLESDLHLSVAVRSFRAEKLSQFVNELVAGNADLAQQIYREIEVSYPVVLTRSLEVARAWLRARARGSERYGLVAASGAVRLKPDGIHVKSDFEPIRWFLNPRDDVRSSFYLEDAATEFSIQGLELDWIGVCWDADFRRENDSWVHKEFKGSGWRNVNDHRRKRYLANSYRVLLTRARQGMVIYVPKGDKADQTRQPLFYDGIASYLIACGIPELITQGEAAQMTQASQTAIA